MKKLFLSTALGLAALSMSAGEYVVYQNGALAEGLSTEYWWNAAVNFNASNPTGAEGKVYTFKAGDGGAAASMGLLAESDNDITGPLHSATLEYDWYATTEGQTYFVRLTGGGVQQDYAFDTTADNIGKWNHTSISVAEKFPSVAEKWNEFAQAGSGYVFSIILEKGKAESAISFDNIKYVNTDDAWEKPYVEQLPAPTSVPVPAHAAADVVSVFGSAYPAATTFGIGGWNQATRAQEMEIDGKKVMKVQYFNYLGWELAQNLDITACNTMHVDFFASNEGAFGFTPISPGAEKAWTAPEVKVGEWNSYDVPMSHWDNVNFANLSQIKFDQGNGNQEGYIANVYFYKGEGGDTPVDPVDPDCAYGNVWNGTESNNLNGVDVNITYTLTANENGTITVNAVMDGVDAVVGFVPEFNFANETGDEYIALAKAGDSYTATSTKTYTLGQNATLFFWLKYAGGVTRIDVPGYKFGASNGPVAVDPKPALTATAENVTMNSADIFYTVTLPGELEGAEVKVMMGETVLTASPYALTGLEQSKDYSYTLTAVATLNGETYESKPVTVEFRTLRDASQSFVWHAIADGMIANAYLPGEDPATARRAIPASIETTVTYNLDGTITVDAIHHGAEVVGMVPKITISSADFKFEYKDMQKDGNKWTITTDTTYPDAHAIGWLYYYIAYDGGSSTINVSGYKTGAENEAVAYGAPASIDLAVTLSVYSVGQTGLASAIVKDANGHYLLDEAAELSLGNSNFTLEGNKLTAVSKGETILTAVAGDLTAEKTLACATSANAVDLIALAGENLVLTSDHENPALAFDGNEGTQLEWNCGETEEHTLTVDFGKVMNVEAIELVWEGASATHYTVALAKPASAADVRRAVAFADNVFTVTDGEGGAGVTPRTTLYRDDYEAIPAQTITLNTTKAHNAVWGIKLKEMRVKGTEGGTTGIEGVTVGSEEPVEYYNLQGIRVANPANGVYIRRQGNTVTKVIL